MYLIYIVVIHTVTVRKYSKTNKAVSMLQCSACFLEEAFDRSSLARTSRNAAWFNHKNNSISY